MESKFDHSDTVVRIRTMTEKAAEQFNELCEEHRLRLEIQWAVVENLISSFSRTITNLEYLDKFESDLSKAYSEFCSTSANFVSFLIRKRTEDSIEEHRRHLSFVLRCKEAVNSVIDKINESRQVAFENASRRSRVSRSSQSKDTQLSNSSSQFAQVHAKAEAARVRLHFAQQETSLLKQKAAIAEQEEVSRAASLRKQKELEAELRLLNTKQEMAATKAEADAFENFDEKSIFQNLEQIETSRPIDPMERTKQFVNEQSMLNIMDKKVPSAELRANAPTFHPSYVVPDQPISQLNFQEVSPCAPDQIKDFTKFLLKKDLLISRLTRFDDQPQTFVLWKSQFEEIMKELEATNTEELDLLTKWLGPTSAKYAASIRSANVLNPSEAIRRIWERLNERYGSPELLESVLMSKLTAFPKLTNKDHVKLYDLLDLLCEIESLMLDPKYHTLLGHFNSSSGIAPILSKLPHNIQEKWIAHAHRYKKQYGVIFPPFSCFVAFMQDISKMKNDPSFIFATESVPNNTSKEKFDKRNNQGKQWVAAKKTEVSQNSEDIVSMPVCPLHKANHSLNDCRGFKQKSFAERKRFLRENKLCFKCCLSDQHRAKECTSQVNCAECGSSYHPSALHINTSAAPHGGEKTTVNSACTQICKDGFSGKSCAKVVLVNLHQSGNPAKSVKAYAIVDDQSNRSLVKPEVFDQLGIECEVTHYQLTSCAGVIDMQGRQAPNLTVTSLDGTSSVTIPIVIECNHIPDLHNEIPTPDVARSYSHLQDIADKIPEINEDIPILILIGRDVPEAHHVVDQRTGARNSPFAQKLALGWVIVGESCLNRVHRPNSVIVNKTHLLTNGRTSIFQPCPNEIYVETYQKDNSSSPQNLDSSVFLKQKDDDTVGLSVDDKSFIKLMDRDVHLSEEGNWEAPLPFREKRQRLPNNRLYALRRAKNLDVSLHKDQTKQEHFMSFMKKIIDKKHAEVAPPLSENEECWYLPIFGVYHPKKPSQIRAVFDSSAKFQNISLNDVLLSGPDLNNKLLGVLLRFRKEPVAVTADIESMFHCFLVDERHRNFLRFFWYRENDIQNELIEYRMRVHVFGNSPSPAVAVYCLRKAACANLEVLGHDVAEFVNRNFYVDDGLVSLPTAEEAISLLKRTQSALQVGGKLRLHKIASNNKDVMDAFPPDDRAKDFSDIDLSTDDLPMLRSLGLNWELESDSFTYCISMEEKTFSKRGLLSTINGIFDPIGFIAPVVVSGKILMRETLRGSYDWDDPLPSHLLDKWTIWKDSLKFLENVRIPRAYAPISLSKALSKELHVFSDASEMAIASVAYLRIVDNVNNIHVGFVLGKCKLAPTSGHSVPRLELCAAVLSVQIYDIISEEFDVTFDCVRFYTDSLVVLGYIYNQSRRFYKYVENRVERIRRSTTPDQWSHVPTKSNPADSGTRIMTAETMNANVWILCPPQLKEPVIEGSNMAYDLCDPENDVEIRRTSNIETLKSTVQKGDHINPLDIVHRLEKFSSWKTTVRAIDMLRNLCLRHQKTTSVSNPLSSELLIVRMVQQEVFSQEIVCLQSEKPLPKSSCLRALNPFIDEHGLLRIGGRLKRGYFSINERHPLIIPSNHLATLLIRHFHETVRHQGRHFTAGALRSAGYWVIGAKRLISSLLHKCLKCRRLRGRFQCQFMSDLPPDRLQQCPPFTFIGIDAFGPWIIVARKTRGGLSNSKRWAILFTCLYSRAIHIEVMEELSSSSFINCLRRFISLRGNVKEIRSDRGSNFVGAIDDLDVNVINVEDKPVRDFLSDQKVTWIFNAPHSSHMGGVWERMIGIARRILDLMLMDLHSKHLTHEVLVTLMAEVCAIVNSRPIAPVSSDPEAPMVLSPNMLLTQKSDNTTVKFEPLDTANFYKSQWRCVQHLANIFWERWKKEYLETLQVRRKWQNVTPNLCVGDLVLVKDSSVARNEWPLGVITNAIKSADDKVRKVEVRLVKDGKLTTYTRPISEIVLLTHEN